MQRNTGDAAATRAQLAMLFELAAQCTEAKLMEAGLLLTERDYSGVVAIAGQVRNHEFFYLQKVFVNKNLEMLWKLRLELEL